MAGACAHGVNPGFVCNDCSVESGRTVTVTELRAITVRQPWAECIAYGRKLVENRGAGFGKKYRGPLLICSAKTWSARGQDDTRVRSTFSGSQDTYSRNCYKALRLGVSYGHRPIWPFYGGVALALAEVEDIHPDSGCCRPWGESEYVGSDQKLHKGVTHIVFSPTVRRLRTPLPVKGALGLWRPDADLLAAVESEPRGAGS